jgi:dihydropyrimidinase
MLDVVLTGGKVVSADGIFDQDVGIRDGKVALLGLAGTLPTEAVRVIDVSGKYLLPGGIDVHVHFNWHMNDHMISQSSVPGSRAAAHGGTTTFVDFAVLGSEGDLIEAIEQKKANLASEKPNVDYALHAMLGGNFGLNLINQLDDAIAAGVTSFKMFTTFAGDIGGVMADDGRIWSVMDRLGRSGGLAMVHCEDNCVIDYNVRRLYQSGQQQGSNIHLARPNLCEEAAISRMLLLSKRTSSPLYIVHVSTHEGVELISEARGKGQPVYGEALHNYLAFTNEDYERPRGLTYHNYPSLKSKADQDALWVGLKSGVLQTIASDDFTVHLKDKLFGHEVDNVSGGHNGIETRIPYLLTESFGDKRLSLPQIVNAASTMPAKLFGLFPKKGVIAAGSDADLVVVNREARRHIQLEDLHSDCDYSIWTDWEFRGWPELTMLRGQVLIENGEWVGPTGSGQFVRARPSSPAS